MIEIRAYNLHWLNCEEGEDNNADLCGHGSVAVELEGKQFVPEDEYCVSAAAVYLLRTLDAAYEKSPDDEHLIPHCGHSMFERDDSEDVLIIGCPDGYDFLVERVGDSIHLRFDEDQGFEIAAYDWERTVCEFSDQVQRLYDDSAAKVCADEVSMDGYKAFRGEWTRRRSQFQLPNVGESL